MNIKRAFQGQGSSTRILTSKPISAKLEDELFKHLKMVSEFINLPKDVQGQIVVDLSARIRNKGVKPRSGR